MPPHIFGFHNEGPQNTNPVDYVLDVFFPLHETLDDFSLTPSNRVVRELQKIDHRVKTSSFRRSVLDAIFSDALFDHYETEERMNRVLRRSERCFGKKKARDLLIKRIEILDTWKNRDANIVPDAFLIDEANKTVVCYEIEDSHPLNINSIGAYGAAWFTLEYIYWDLHLIAYDIYGHSKVIVFPHAEIMAKKLRMRGSRT